MSRNLILASVSFLTVITTLLALKPFKIFPFIDSASMEFSFLIQPSELFNLFNAKFKAHPLKVSV